MNQQILNDGSDLAFLSYIKKLLDNLETSKFLFTAKAKVPCMHMCIWAVTSVLKIFENRSEIFMQLTGGPPPPPSDSEMDDEDSQSESGVQSRRDNNNAAASGQAQQ